MVLAITFWGHVLDTVAVVFGSREITFTLIVGFCFSNFGMSLVCTGKVIPSKFRLFSYGT